MFFIKFKIHWFEIWFFCEKYIFLDIGKLMGKCTQSEINSQIFRTKRQIHFGNIHFVIQHLKSDGEPRQGNINSNCNWIFGWSYFQSKRSTNKMQNKSYFPLQIWDARSQMHQVKGKLLHFLHSQCNLRPQNTTLLMTNMI